MKNNINKAMQGIIDNFNEAVIYKIYRDTLMYGECVLDTSEETIKELGDIWKKIR